jgi:hypothetical protein
LPYFTKFLAGLALCASFLPFTHGAQNADVAKPAIFPPLISYSLSHAKLNLPADFAGQLNLLFISFQPEQQTQVETWMPVARALQHTNFIFHWYRLPVSSRENIVFRWWENSSMRSDETDPEMWPWIVPLYIDKDDFRRRLQIPNERQIAVILIDKNGRVLWRAEGPLTAGKRNSLTATVAAAK